MKKILLLATVLIFSCTNSDLDKINSENKKNNPIDSDNTKTNPTDSDNKNMIDGILFDQSTFEKNRKLWRKQKIANYQFSFFEMTSAGPRANLIFTIKNRKFDTIMYKKPYYHDSNKPIGDFYSAYSYTKTIDDLYNYIEKEVADLKIKAKNENHQKLYSIEIKYDSEYHYPTKIDFGVSYLAGPTPDGMWGPTITISDFKIKKNNPTDSDNNNMTDVLFDQSTFEKNRKLWREQKIANYQFSFFKMASYGPSPNLIYTVKNIKFDTVIYKDPNYYNHDKPIVDVYPEYIDTKTIDDIYNSIEKTAAYLKKCTKNKDHRSYYTIKVEYDSEYHYPTKIDYDEHYKTMPIPDGGLCTTITIGVFNIK